MTMIVTFGLFFAFTKLFIINCKTPAGTQQATETLSYEILKDSSDNNKLKIKLTLGGTNYVNDKKCRIMRSNEAELAKKNPTSTATEFNDIDNCPNKDSTADGKCVINCKNDGIILTYNNLSPRTQYIFVHLGTQVANMVQDSGKRNGKIFGYSIPLLSNPEIAISTTENEKKLKLSAKSCPPVNCPIFYKDIKYEAGTKESDCVTPNSANGVGFDLLLPYYEMRCEHYPYFYYNMPNAYMKIEIEIYKPQFYAVLKENNKVGIKFTNSLSSEICLFSLKSALTGDQSQNYISICGKANSACYAPCKDVVVDGIAGKKIYKILIQTRHHDIKANNKESNGYMQTKFVNIEPTNGFLTLETSVGVTFDGSLLTPTTGTKFEKCTLQHYEADKPMPASLSDTKCNDATKNGEKCKDDCSKLVIQELAPGKAYVIEVQESGITNPANFKEKIFIRTKNKQVHTFEQTLPAKSDQTAILTAVGGAATTNKDTEPTCEYFVSHTEKNSFYPAKCSNSNPCRDLCRDRVTIEGLEPNTSYDIKVIAHKDYDIKIYKNIKTDLTTLVIKHAIKVEGLFLNAQLSAVDPGAHCIYTVQIKNGNDYADAYTCPLITPSPNPSPSKIPLSSEFRPRISSFNARYDNSQKINSQRKDGEVLQTQFSVLNQVTQKSVSSSSGGSTSNSCSSNPLCSSIIYKEYDANKEYIIIVTAIDKSSQKVFTLDPSNSNPNLSAPKANPTESSKIIEPFITRENDNFIITTILPAGMDDTSKCKWMVRNNSVKSNPIVKSCMGEGVDGCTNFVNCKKFTIEGFPDENSYLLTVYKAEDLNIFGSKDIEHGATSSSSSTGNTKLIIIIVSVIVALVIIIIGVTILKKKKSD